LTLKTPDSPLLAQLTDRAGMVLPPEAVQKAGARFGLHPICSGRFSFVERVAQDRIVLQRFPGYWNANAIHFDRVIYLPIPNAAVRLANLQAGSLDIVEQILPTDVPAVRRDTKLKLAIDDSLAYEGITFNTGNGPAAKTTIGQSALVRRAFELTIDRRALIEVVYAGMYAPTSQANPPGSPYYDGSVRLPPRDVAAAKALLIEAGVTPPVPVTLTIPDNPDLLQAGQVIQAMARDAGFAVKIQAMEFASSLQAGYAGNFQAYLIGWSGRSDPDGNMWQFLHTGGTFNYGHYSDAMVNKALDEARLYTDLAHRRSIYAKVWQQERKDLPLLYLWTPKNIVGMKSSLDGFVQIPDGIIRLQGVHFAR
jgi:peptide/nickel transport system substrate-binding protein